MIIQRLVVLILVAIAAQAAQASGINGYAAMGASETAGTSYTGSWVPYLANQRGANFGGAGQPYNVAVGGATSATLLTEGQHTEVASLVQSGNVDLSFLSIGGNDFSAVGGQIAGGSLSGPALTAWAQGVVTNIDTAMDTVLSAHPIGMIVAGMPDIPLTPAGRVGFDTPTKLQRGEAAVDLFDSLLLPEVLARGLVFVDFSKALRDLNAAPLVVGGVTIDMVNASTDPTHFFQDGKHPAAVGNGLVANLFLKALNIGYGTNFALLTDLEILTTAGLAGSYTGETSNLPYANYITAVPEPSTIALIMAAFLTGSLFWRRSSKTSTWPGG
ncbi:MAG: PEP-CTERM sorting domain-containing protein [Planctomycetia bacterium]|nr:PEP-CTERM sorting domain-containing protein [Planctomycetia bacterium]